MISKKIDQELMNTIYKVYRTIREQFSFNESFNDLTILQFHTLSFLGKVKGTSVKNLSSFLKISMPTTTVLVSRLNAMALVKKTKNIKDKRIVDLELTREGKKMVTRITKEKQRRFKVFFSKLNSDDKLKLITILKKIIK